MWRGTVQIENRMCLFKSAELIWMLMVLLMKESYIVKQAYVWVASNPMALERAFGWVSVTSAMTKEQHTGKYIISRESCFYGKGYFKVNSAIISLNSRKEYQYWIV